MNVLCSLNRTGLTWGLRAGALLWSFAACQTPTHEQSATAVGRSPQAHSRAVRSTPQVLKAHASSPRDRLDEVLTQQCAEVLPGWATQLAALATPTNEASPQRAALNATAFFDTVAQRGTSMGLVYSRVTPEVAVLELASEPAGATASVGMVAQADVEGWEGLGLAAFAPESRDGQLQAAGVFTRKGPLAAAMVALAALKAARVARPFVTRLLLVLPQDGGPPWATSYLEQRPAPEFTITLDGAYPVTQGQQGVASVKLLERLRPSRGASKGCHITQAGAAAPAGAWTATLQCAGPAEVVRALLEDALAPVKVERRGEYFGVTLPSLPALVTALTAPQVLDDAAGGSQLLTLLNHGALDPAGQVFGLAGEQAAWGRNTLKLGRLEVQDGLLWATLSVRFSPGLDVDQVVKKVTKGAQEWATRTHQPLRVGVTGGGVNAWETRSLAQVKALLAAHERVTGHAAPAVTAGVGSDARWFPHAVALGPLEPPEGAVNPNAVSFQTLSQWAQRDAWMLWELAQLGARPSVNPP